MIVLATILACRQGFALFRTLGDAMNSFPYGLFDVVLIHFGDPVRA